jgi:hypothetical protein
MAYFNYHAKLRWLLEPQPYIYITETGKFAGRFHFPALGTSMPIRDYRVPEYQKYINREATL